MHTLWVKHHNKIAKTMKQLQPDFDDERLYQESRKIVVALQQWITYNEFLPRVIGSRFIHRYNLYGSLNDRYDPHSDATITNEFATAAFRFGHTLIRDIFKLSSSSNGSTHNYPLKGNFFDPTPLYEAGQPRFGNCMKFLKGMNEASNKLDPFVTDAMRDHMFGRNSEPGLDIVSLNIQRGRDHGLHGYVAYRQKFYLWIPRNFDDLAILMSNQTIQSLKTVYQDVWDIDLFTGIISENPVPEGMIGELGAHILAEQFRRLKFGDRFWFEWNQGEEWSFNRCQIGAIKEVTLSKVMCDNAVTSTGEDMPENIFDASSQTFRCTPGPNPSMSMVAWLKGIPAFLCGQPEL